MTVLTFHRAETHEPRHTGDTYRIAGWVQYKRTITTPWAPARELEVMVPIYAGATCELHERPTT